MATPPLDALRRSMIIRNIFLMIAGAAILVWSVVGVIQAITINNLRAELDDTRVASECRFDINAETDAISGTINVTVAQIVVAAISDDEAEVQQLGHQLADHVKDLAEANDRRLKAVEVCNASNEEGS
jgi:hypothetical protein